MATNLNKAFMRAYAKDSGRPVPDLAAAAPENRAVASTPSRQQPVESRPQPASGAAMPRQFAATQPVNSQPLNAQPVSQAPITAPHFRAEAAGQTQIISGRYAQQAAPAPSAGPTPSAAEAASVWQRIDAAQSIQPPHLAHPPARPIATSVGVGAASGPKRMQAAAAAPSAPSAPTARMAEMDQPQPIDLPLLPEEANAPLADSESVETRRRTVADFLYSAGKISGSATSPARPAASGAVPQASPARPLGRSAGAPADLGATRTSVSATAASTNVGGSSLAGSAPVFVAPGRASAVPAAAAVQSPLYAASSATAAPPVHAPSFAPTKYSAPEAVPGPVSAPSIHPPSKRTGQILRVDVPPQARRSDTGSSRTMPAQQASDQAMLDEVSKPEKLAAAPESSFTSDGAGQQRRVDRAHELSEAEQSLRRSKHKIFNPVWEVDSLQWPSVCDKLMEHRAESMAQVAAHLKAACQDGLNILGVTSPTSGEGRTTVACCLARLAAAHGLNVALIDLDLDHPTLCLQTNLEVEQDWRDCLNGDVALDEVAVHSIDDQLTLLPLRDRSERPDLLASDMGVADLLRELSESFELVIVDACRMDSAGNVLSGLAAAQIFDAAIVVVDRRNAHQERIEESVRALQQTGVGSIGIVDNFSM